MTRCVRRPDAKFNLQRSLPAVVGKRLQLAAVERGRAGSRKTVLNQVIAIPPVFVTNEAEEIIDNATAGGGNFGFV
jgi:hypothetical protein